MTLNNIESNKINNTKSKMNLTHFIMLHIDQILNMNIYLLTLISSSAFNTGKLM